MDDRLTMGRSLDLDPPMVGYAKALSADQLKLQDAAVMAEALSVSSNRLTSIVEEIVNDACSSFNNCRLSVVSRYPLQHNTLGLA